MKKNEEVKPEIDLDPSKDNANLELALLRNLTDDDKTRIKYKAGMDILDVIKSH